MTSLLGSHLNRRSGQVCGGGAYNQRVRIRHVSQIAWRVVLLKSGGNMAEQRQLRRTLSLSQFFVSHEFPSDVCALTATLRCTTDSSEKGRCGDLGPRSSLRRLGTAAYLPRTQKRRVSGMR